MIHFIKFFHGYLFVTLTGYAPERFFNLCSHLGIVLWGIRPREDGYSFFISRKAFSSIDSALEKTGTTIHIEKKIGIPYLIKRYRKHYFFLIGIGCACFLLFYMSQFIWRVEISGNSCYSTQVLLKGLEKQHIGYATRKSSINCKELQTMLRKQYEDITWVSAKIEGTRLYIEIQERLKAVDDTRKNDMTSPEGTNLLANMDGTIKSITTRRGTPMAEAGDSVSKGDVLVSGVVELEGDGGELIGKNYVSADADVIIHTTIPYKDCFSKHYEKKVFTGKKRTRWMISMNHYFISLISGKQAENVIVTKKNIPLIIGRDFYLPLELIRQEEKEYKVEQFTRTEDEIRQLVEEHLEEYQKKILENGIHIMSNSVIIEYSGDNVLVHGDLEVDAEQKDYQIISPEEMQEGIHLNGIDTGDVGNTR